MLKALLFGNWAALVSSALLYGIDRAEPGNPDLLNLKAKNALWEINPTSLETTRIGETGIDSSLFRVNSLSINPITCEMWILAGIIGTANSQLFKVSPSDGNTAQVGLVIPALQTNDISFGNDGILYAWNSEIDSLVTIPLTGGATIVIPTNVNSPTGTESVEWDKDTDVLYLKADVHGDALYVVDFDPDATVEVTSLQVPFAAFDQPIQASLASDPSGNFLTGINQAADYGFLGLGEPQTDLTIEATSLGSAPVPFTSLAYTPASCFTSAPTMSPTDPKRKVTVRSLKPTKAKGRSYKRYSPRMKGDSGHRAVGR